jgi:lysophospholipase L1-like esterase
VDRRRCPRRFAFAFALAFAVTGCSGGAGGEAQHDKSRWDYVALGDSVPYGAGDVAGRSFVPLYAHFIEQDTGASVRVHNLATDGGTARVLLGQLRNDPKLRRALKGAEILTISIGANDLESHLGDYASNRCGGPDNQTCFRAAVMAFKPTWAAILAVVLRLRADKSIIRVTNDYNPFPGNARAAANLGKGITDVFTRYLRQLNAYRCSSAEHVGILCADVAKAFNGANTNESAFAKGLIGTDEFSHPSAKGHRLIAQTLRALGYHPLDLGLRRVAQISYTGTEVWRCHVSSA